MPGRVEPEDPEGPPGAIPPPSLDSPPALTPADLTVSVGLAVELVEIESRLLAMWRQESGVAAIMEHRALTLGRLLGYLESIMLRTPGQIQILGALYARLLLSERQTWEANRLHRRAKSITPTESDLAALADE